MPGADDPAAPTAALMLAPAAPALVPGCTAKASMAGAPAWIFFTRPGAPCRGSGGVDDGHIFSISVDSVAKALYDAQKDGGDVWISTDGQVGESKDVSKTVYLQASIRDSRLAIVNRLVKIKNGKCDVRIAAHTVEREALSRLKAAGIPIRRGPIHDKAFIMYGKFGGSWKYGVYTGSHNLGYSAARLFDEIFVKLAPESGASHAVYDAFKAHFEDAWNAGTPL